MLPNRASWWPDLIKSLGNVFCGMHDRFTQPAVQKGREAWRAAVVFRLQQPGRARAAWRRGSEAVRKACHQAAGTEEEEENLFPRLLVTHRFGIIELSRRTLCKHISFHQSLANLAYLLYPRQSGQRVWTLWLKPAAVLWGTGPSRPVPVSQPSCRRQA